MKRNIGGLLILLAILAAGSWSTRPVGADTHPLPLSNSSRSGADTEGRILPPLTTTPVPTATYNPFGGYVYTTATGTIVPGTTYVPNSSCNACASEISLPFPWNFYGTVYTGARASNKGALEFAGFNVRGDNNCNLPVVQFHPTQFVYWDDLNTFIDDTQGIYTSVSGTAPNRIFNIEWRAGLIGADARANFETRLYEGQYRFDFVYGQTPGGISATIGVQSDLGGPYTTFACNAPNVVRPGTVLRWDRAP